MSHERHHTSDGEDRGLAGPKNGRLAAGVAQLRAPRRETQRRALLLRATIAAAEQRFSETSPDFVPAAHRQDENALGAADVDQLRQRWERVRAEVLASPERFLEQGAVVATWRTRAGRRFGPYFRLVYRVDARQQSIYLGMSEALARAVRELLNNLRRPLERQRALRRCRQHATGLLRSDLRRLQDDLTAESQRLPQWQVRRLRRVIRGLRSIVRPRSGS